jgi:RNA polymerase-binding transcription factor DksA
MADWTDHADEIINVLQGAAVGNARAAAIPNPPPEFDGKHCVDCDEPIHPARLAHGLYRCIDCATYLERYARVSR